ncbi:HEPN domain-containing protein [Lysinibacillus sp. CD3-6]|uniref:HEPN domain-containing protein n=1 Tax=Lysinibacillus sp. CD3-6 TaxID=2892541 RepID=UPI0011201F39|nr:HEPN domain-containing protein [Lysinibacillus sp. CD3-6]UED81970.1 HEPN domain-containing protein [Lysinibacillus sp. CD3-6]
MKDIFSYNGDINKTAYMNWRTSHHDHLHNMHVIAKGFADSSLVLVEQILKNNNEGKAADSLIFPILFNANHAIEVYLKSLIWTLNTLLRNGKNYDNTHNLKVLLNEVKKLEKEFENKLDYEDFFGKLENYINELYKKIEIQNNKGNTFSDITFARYSLTRDKEPQFYINEFDNVVVDLSNFILVFNEIFKNLDNLSIHYQDLIEMRNEMESYYE